MITYIFNGFDIKKHFGKRVSELFQKDMKNYEKIVFIPGEFDDIDKVKRYVLTDVSWFKEIGIDIKKVDILTSSMTKDDMINAINNTDIIFIMGGDTRKQNIFLDKYNLKEIIKNFKKVVIGISAGAINLGNISLCSKDLLDGVEETTIYDGIGRINYTIEPHFDINNLSLLNEELYPLSNNIKIYGLPNDTGIRIVDDNYTIIEGDYYLIHNKKVKNL